VYNGNSDITRMLDQPNLSTQRCRLIFWVECGVGGHLVLAKTGQWTVLLYLGQPTDIVIKKGDVA
jgi:hypothetical protein